MAFSLLYSGSTIRVGTREALIGRSPACKVVLNDEAVSRRHARISQTPDGFFIEDLDSANGVMVNGEEVHGPHPLNENDVILIGSHKLTFQRAASAPHSLKRRQYRTGSDFDVLWDDVEPEEATFMRGHTTARRDRLVMLGAAADVDLAAGNLASAERLLKKELMRMLLRAERDISQEALDDCVRYALALNREEGSTDWLEYVLTLLSNAEAGADERTLKQLADARKSGKYPALFKEYLEVLRDSKHPRAAATQQALSSPS